jgi:hypothetical protein
MSDFGVKRTFGSAAAMSAHARPPPGRGDFRPHSVGVVPTMFPERAVRRLEMLTAERPYRRAAVVLGSRVGLGLRAAKY